MSKSLSLSLVSIYLELWRYHNGFLKGWSMSEGKPGSQRQNSEVGIRMWCRAAQYCWSCHACLISCPQFLLSSQAFLRLMSTPLDVEYDKPSAPQHFLHPNPIYGLSSHLAKMYVFKILSPVHNMKWWHLCTKMLEDSQLSPLTSRKMRATVKSIGTMEQETRVTLFGNYTGMIGHWQPRYTKKQEHCAPLTWELQ